MLKLSRQKIFIYRLVVRILKLHKKCEVEEIFLGKKKTFQTTKYYIVIQRVKNTLICYIICKISLPPVPISQAFHNLFSALIFIEIYKIQYEWVKSTNCGMITFINVHFLHRFNSACKSHLSADPRILCCDVHSLSNMWRYYSTLVLVIILPTILVIIICKWRQVKTFFTFKKRIKLYNSHLVGT